MNAVPDSLQGIRCAKAVGQAARKASLALLSKRQQTIIELVNIKAQAQLGLRLLLMIEATMMNRVIFRVLLLLFVGSLFDEADAWDRKGRVMKRSSKPMTMRAGGVTELKSHSLTVKKTEQGLLLYAERKLTMNDHHVAIGYLAYNPDKEEAGLKIVSEPGPGCYWKTRSGKDQTRYLSILEIEHLQIPAGAMAGWELREKDGTLIVAKSESDIYKKSVWIGTYVEYDNLDDGK